MVTMFKHLQCRDGCSKSFHSAIPTAATPPDCQWLSGDSPTQLTPGDNNNRAVSSVAREQHGVPYSASYFCCFLAVTTFSEYFRAMKRKNKNYLVRARSVKADYPVGEYKYWNSNVVCVGYSGVMRNRMPARKSYFTPVTPVLPKQRSENLTHPTTGYNLSCFKEIFGFELN